MGKRLLTGKWLRDAMPKQGWLCAGMVDLRAREPQAPTEICQMCEARHIRYVHILQHGAWPEPLRVGFTCAERMEGNPDAPRQREREIRAEARRLERWVNTGWATISNERGATVTQRNCGDWRIEVVSCGEHCLLHLRHLASNRVVTTKRTQSLILAKYDGWDIWHEGEAIRTAYLEGLAKERRLQREREEEARRAEDAERRAEWQRAHPDWDANERAWSDWLDWREQNTRQRRLGRSRNQALLAIPDGPANRWHAAFREANGTESRPLSTVYPTADAALAAAEEWVKNQVLVARYGAGRVGSIMANWYALADDCEREAAEAPELLGTWRRSQKGSYWTQTIGYRAVVFEQRGSGRFSFNVADRRTNDCIWGPSAGFALRQTAQAAAERELARLAQSDED